MPAIVNSDELAQKRIFLVLATPGNIRQCNIDLIREIADNGFHTVVITTNFPYSILTRLYRDQGIDPGNVSFIDAVTKNSVGSVQNIPGVVRFVNHPSDLTEMGIAVTEVLKELSGKKVCILYDSISTMLIYLSSSNISRFIHFVTNRLRLTDVSGIFLAVEKGLDPMLMTQLTTFVDTVIDTG